MNKQFIITEDGSQTIYLPELDEHYHSTHGAVQESVHVYIQAGFLQLTRSEINILEIGFGTGLNVFLTYGYAQKSSQIINYYSIEKFPLSFNEYEKLNYPESIFSEYEEVFRKIHDSHWNETFELSPNFWLTKIQADLTEYQFDKQRKFDLVYYDAFAPGKQPEMWTDALISKVSGSIATGGILTTYCAKGTVRRAFAASGLSMERLPGPPGKKEILRGKKAF